MPMTQPVLASDGYTYDEANLKAWAVQCHVQGRSPRSPVTNMLLGPFIRAPRAQLLVTVSVQQLYSPNYIRALTLRVYWTLCWTSNLPSFDHAARHVFSLLN